jgi:hypothetical protein
MDDWSLLPSRNAVSAPAPNPKSTMTTTPHLLARLTRPRQAPPAGADHHPRRQTTRLTRPRSPGTPATNPGAKPRNPYQPRRSMPHRNHSVTSKAKDPNPRLDNTRPFMDDTGRPRTQSRGPGRRGRARWARGHGTNAGGSESGACTSQRPARLGYSPPPRSRPATFGSSTRSRATLRRVEAPRLVRQPT